jgi:hypothetical protein
MTDKHKKALILFIIRTPMYILCEDDNNVVAFIHGYEIGTNDKCKFTKLLSQYFEKKLSIRYRADGWPGQIRRYAYKKGIPWLIAFKQIGLDVLASEENGGLDKETQKIIKTNIEGLIKTIDENGHPWFNGSWIKDWRSICIVKSDWFKKLWTEQEFKIIKSLTHEVNNKQIFEDWKPVRPTKSLLALKTKYFQNQ